MSFGKRLKQARKNKKLLQTEVANKLGIDDTTISKYENDKSEPDNKTINELATLYGVTVDWLIGRNEKEREMNPGVEKMIDDFAGLNDKDQQYILELIERLKKERP